MSHEHPSPRQVEPGYWSSAEFQDYVYHDLPYSDEADVVIGTIMRHFRRSVCARVDDLDVLELGCGTGRHLVSLFNQGFNVQGLDSSPHQLAVARRRFKRMDSPYYSARGQAAVDIPLHQQSMLDFKLEEQVDAIVCIGSIGNYLDTDELQQGLTNTAEHLRPGGIFIANGSWASGLVQAKPRFYQDGKLTVLRTGRNHREGRVVTVTHQYLADLGLRATAGEGVVFIEENFSFALYTDEEYMAAYRAAGLEIDEPVQSPFFKTPLFIGRKALERQMIAA